MRKVIPEPWEGFQNKIYCLEFDIIIRNGTFKNNNSFCDWKIEIEIKPFLYKIFFLSWAYFPI